MSGHTGNNNVTAVSGVPNPAVSEAVHASFEASGMMQGIGARIVELRAGLCAIELPFSPRVAQQHGFFHGGAIGTLADTAGGYAAMTTVPIGTDVLTLEYKINFLRPATGRLLVAKGEVLRAGRSVIVTRVDVFDEDQRVCAVMQQTIVPAAGAEASGR